MIKVLKFLLVGALVWLPMAMNAQDEIDYRAVLEQVCEEMNEELPEDLGEDLYMMAVVIKDNNLVMKMMLLDGTDFSTWDDEMIRDFDELMEEDLDEDGDFAALKYMCHMARYGLVLKIEDAFDNVLTTYIDVD